MSKKSKKVLKKLFTVMIVCVILIFAAEKTAAKTLNLQGFPVLTLRAPEKNLEKRFKEK